MLSPILPADAARIVAGVSLPEDNWHEQYPFIDELDPLRSLAASAAPDPVFTLYQVRDADGQAVGGIGFFGPPDDKGVVEVGYGLVPAARGHGLATGALLDAVAIAIDAGARAVTADTFVDNLPSQRVLLRAGFVETGRDEKLVYFRRELAAV